MYKNFGYKKGRPARKRTAQEIAWLAGLIEGEGCFMWKKVGPKPYRYRYPTMAIGMTDHDVMKRVAWLLGGQALYHDDRPPPRKRIWRAEVSGSRAVGWMFTFYSFMGRRRRSRIRELLDEYLSKPTGAYPKEA